MLCVLGTNRMRGCCHENHSINADAVRVWAEHDVVCLQESTNCRSLVPPGLNRAKPAQCDQLPISWAKIFL
jgi:hypothetical protein